MTDELEVPHVEEAPGLRWRRRNDQWEAIWRARADLIARGFTPKNQWLWRGHEPTPAEVAEMQDTCRRLQDEMLAFSRGGLPKVGTYNGTLRSLIDCYQTDKLSTYHKLRYHVRVRHDQMLKRIVARHGHEEIADIKARVVIGWHQEWGGETKVAAAHAFVGQLRTLFGFGASILEDDECERLCGVMHRLRFPMSKPRTERLTAEQVIAIRKEAHKQGHPSIALGQAFQFECILRQKDVIGEWVPLTEPGTSDITHYARNRGKWLRGLRWNEIDQNLILRHTTSKRLKPIEFDLKLAPMVMEELSYLAHMDPGPKQGAVVICETTGRPWVAGEYRRKWRLIANAAGIPKHVLNMDSRAGGISEATDAGADIEHVRHAATHSNTSTTARYSRGTTEKIANVMQIRSAFRNKKDD